MGNTVGSQLREVIIGTLLGDGFFEQNGKNRRFVCAHSVKQELYIKWKFNQVKQVTQCSLVRKNRQDPRNGRFYPYYQLRSISSPVWDEFYTLFYKDKRRIIPQSLPKIISARMLAVWLMDDGYRRNDCNAVRLNTQCYSYDDHQIIKQSLKNLGIESTIHRQTKYFVTYIPSYSMDLLRSIVNPYIIPSMKYKITWPRNDWPAGGGSIASSQSWQYIFAIKR